MYSLHEQQLEGARRKAKLHAPEARKKKRNKKTAHFLGGLVILDAHLQHALLISGQSDVARGFAAIAAFFKVKGHFLTIVKAT